MRERRLVLIEVTFDRVCGVGGIMKEEEKNDRTCCSEISYK